jgi:hypothetical protein
MILCIPRTTASEPFSGNTNDSQGLAHHVIRACLQLNNAAVHLSNQTFQPLLILHSN